MKTRLMAAAAPLVLGAGLLGGFSVTAAAKTDASSAATAPAYNGPFAKPSALPLHAPDFTQYKDSDWQPAIEAGIAAKRAEIKAIAGSKAKPTFENTIVSMERAGTLYDRVYNVFSQLTSANTSDALDAIDTAVSPQISALNDDIYLDDALFARVKAVHDSASGKALTGEDAMLLATTYDKFVHRGALLSAAQKVELKAMNLEIAKLETAFSQKLTTATAAKAPIFDTAAQLDGLSQAEITAAGKLAAEKGHAGKFMLALGNTTQQAALASLTNRDSRKKLWDASINRTSGGDEYDTTAMVTQMATLRAKKAKLLGAPDFATYQMYDRMVKTPAKAMEFMKGFVPALRATQDREAAMLEAAMKAEGTKAGGQNVTLAPWDWSYYAEKVRKAKYELDESQIKPYFEVWRTLEDGVFYAANQTYGLTFKRRTDLPVYHPTMRAYEVFDADGKQLAIF